MFEEYKMAELTLAEYQNHPSKGCRRMANYYNWTVYELFEEDDWKTVFGTWQLTTRVKKYWLILKLIIFLNCLILLKLYKILNISSVNTLRLLNLP